MIRIEINKYNFVLIREDGGKKTRITLPKEKLKETMRSLARESNPEDPEAVLSAMRFAYSRLGARKFEFS